MYKFDIKKELNKKMSEIKKITIIKKKPTKHRFRLIAYMLTSTPEKDIVINKFGSISRGTSGGTAVKKTFKSVVHSLGIKGEEKLKMAPIYIAIKRLYSNIDKKKIKIREKKLTKAKLEQYKSRLNKYFLYKEHYEQAKNNIIPHTRCEHHPQKYNEKCDNCNKVGIRAYINFLMKARSQRIKTHDSEFNDELIGQVKFGYDVNKQAINKQNLNICKEKKSVNKLNKTIKQKKMKCKKQTEVVTQKEVGTGTEGDESQFSLIKFVNDVNETSTNPCYYGPPIGLNSIVDSCDTNSSIVSKHNFDCFPELDATFDPQFEFSDF
jgi:hypothetical protein